MVKRITRVATTIIESCFDENAKQRFHNRAIAKASLCVGDDRNKYTSTIRIHLIDPNSSPTLIRVLEDDPALYTVRSESPSTQIAWRIFNISSTPRHRSRWTISRSNMPTNLPRILQHGTIYRTGVQKNNAILWDTTIHTNVWPHFFQKHCQPQNWQRNRHRDIPKSKINE